MSVDQAAELVAGAGVREPTAAVEIGGAAGEAARAVSYLSAPGGRLNKAPNASAARSSEACRN
jgi:hypothetical protein